MAWYRRSRRTRTYRPLRYRRSRISRPYRSLQNNLLAARQQRDIARFTLKYRDAFKLEVLYDQKATAAAISMWQVLGQSPQFEAIHQLFDQVHMRGVHVKLIPTWQVSSTDSARMTQVTAWDRNGVYSGNALPSYDEICTYGSSYKQAASAFSKNSVSSSLAASDLAERTQFIDTTIIPMISTGNLSNVQVQGAEQGVYVPMINRVAFNPVFLVGIELPVKATAKQTFNYELEITFDLVFRGTRVDNKV